MALIRITQFQRSYIVKEAFYFFTQVNRNWDLGKESLHPESCGHGDQMLNGIKSITEKHEKLKIYLTYKMYNFLVKFLFYLSIYMYLFNIHLLGTYYVPDTELGWKYKI